MREFEIYIPLTYNDGSAVEEEKIDKVGRRLLKFFEGLTYFPQKNKGVWKMGKVVFHDEIVIYRVLSHKTHAARKFLKRLKETLKKELDQEEILLVEKSADTL